MDYEKEFIEAAESWYDHSIGRYSKLREYEKRLLKAIFIYRTKSKIKNATLRRLEPSTVPTPGPIQSDLIDKSKK